MPLATKTSAPRAAIYARYSSDNQSAASIDDQVRICRAEIERREGEVVKVYSDYAISGSSVFRPEYQKLIADAAAGAFDVVVAEGLDRLSRDLADVATLHKQLSYLGIALVTVVEGPITELHVGLKGTMNQLYIKDLAQKTHRGLEGRVRSGKSGGGRSYGYDLVPGQLGEFRINPEKAAVVRRIFQEYAASRSPRVIARGLNQDGVRGPRSKEWRDTTIRGHITRGSGVLNNELYVGRRVWDRQGYRKDPANRPPSLAAEEARTGPHRGRPRAPHRQRRAVGRGQGQAAWHS